MPARIKGLGENSRIVHLGDFFRHQSKPYWSLFMWCHPIQSKKSTRLSNLPLLSRGRIINSTRRRSNHPDRIITLIPEYNIQPTTLGEFPEISQFESVVKVENVQNAFRIIVREDHKIIVPQLELARAIFLMNSYLCRACLSTTILQQEFQVKPVYGRKHVDIHVLKTGTFPKSAYDQSGTSHLLAWMLTSPAAMASYESIFKHYQSNRQGDGSKEVWRFSFEPPPMTNWQLHVKGRLSIDKKIYLVEEIVGIIFDVEMPESVGFIHPDFRKNKVEDESALDGAGSVNWTSNNEEFEIDDEQSASDDSEALLLEGDSSWIRFTKPFKVYKQERVKKSNRLIIDELGDKEAGRQVSTDEPHQGGELPAADVGGKHDVTDRNCQFASRFHSFNLMLKVLSTKYGCVIVDQETLPLPRVGRSKQHQLKDGSARVIRAVRISHRATEAVLLEVDTSDGIKMLSTKLIFKSTIRDWTDHFIQIRKGVVAKSISWPNDLLDHIFGQHQHVGINHPKHQGSEAGNIPVESIDSWAFRFIQYLQQDDRMLPE